MCNTLSRRNLNKLKAIKIMGGKCKTCGETHPAKLTFHHIDPYEKEELISKLLAGDFSSLYEELKKCILLCSNCHREFHFLQEKELTNSKNIFLEFKNIFSCEQCGYDKCIAALDFHHIKDKKKRIALFNFECKGKTVKELTESVKNELNKCIVICSNCHQKHHSTLNNYDKMDHKIIEKKLKNIKFNENFSEKLIIKEFLNGIKNYKKIAKKFNIYASTVKKILIKHNLIKSINLNPEEIINLHKSGKQNIEIAEIFNCNMRTIERILLKFNLKARKLVNKEGIIKYFLENPTKNNRYISEKFNCSIWSVQIILKPYRDDICQQKTF